MNILKKYSCTILALAPLFVFGQINNIEGRYSIKDASISFSQTYTFFENKTFTLVTDDTIFGIVKSKGTWYFSSDTLILLTKEKRSSKKVTFNKFFISKNQICEIPPKERVEDAFGCFKKE